MPKAKAKRRASQRPRAVDAPTPDELLQAARREERQLRALKSLMNVIRRKRLDNEANGVQLARVLVAGTGYVVIGELELKALEHETTRLAESLQLANEENARAYEKLVGERA